MDQLGFCLWPHYERAGDVTPFGAFQTILEDDDWGSSELTSTCEQFTVWLQLPGQEPQTVWVLDYNIVQFKLIQEVTLAIWRIIFVPSSGYPLTHTQSAANSEYLNDCGWPQTSFKKLLSSSSSYSLVPLISLILQSASREIRISEGHSRRYTEPSSLPWRGSFLDKKWIRNPIGLGIWEVFFNVSLTHWVQRSC